MWLCTSAIPNKQKCLQLACTSSGNIWTNETKQTNSMALSPRANYTDWATATCRRNLVSTFGDRVVSSGQRGGSPTVVNLSFLDREIYEQCWTDQTRTAKVFRSATIMVPPDLGRNSQRLVQVIWQFWQTVQILYEIEFISQHLKTSQQWKFWSYISKILHKHCM
jgi:hypothetical protein